MGAMDDTDPTSTRPGWERRCFRVSMVGGAVMLLTLLVWLFAPHGNGWPVAFLIGAALFLGGVAAAAIMQRVTTGRDRSARQLDSRSGGM